MHIPYDEQAAGPADAGIPPRAEHEHATELITTRTPRGFTWIQFTDYNGQACALLESSLATEPAIRLIVEEQRGCGLHLTRAMLAQLLPALTYFAQTGYLPSSPDPAAGPER